MVKNNSTAISGPINFMKFWKYLCRSVTSKVDGSLMMTKHSEHIITLSPPKYKNPSAATTLLVGLSYRCTSKKCGIVWQIFVILLMTGNPSFPLFSSWYANTSQVADQASDRSVLCQLYEWDLVCCSSWLRCCWKNGVLWVLLQMLLGVLWVTHMSWMFFMVDLENMDFITANHGGEAVGCTDESVMLMTLRRLLSLSHSFTSIIPSHLHSFYLTLIFFQTPSAFSTFLWGACFCLLILSFHLLFYLYFTFIIVFTFTLLYFILFFHFPFCHLGTP